jgi:Tfp pilus assembly protein PilF
MAAVVEEKHMGHTPHSTKTAHLMSIIGLLVATSPCPGSTAHLSLSNALHQYSRSGCFGVEYNQVIWNIVSEMVRNTRFQDKITINSDPRSDSVNVYILKSDPKGYFPGLRCNCAYLGEQNAIVCDATLLRHFQHLVDLPPSDPMGESLNEHFSMFLLRWILGHEVGHLVHKHSIASWYFQEKGSQLGGEGEKGLAPAVTPQDEEEADTYAIEHLPGLDDVFFGWLTLSSVVDTMCAEALHERGTQISSSELQERIFKHTITIRLRKSRDVHPPWLIRVLHMHSLLANHKAFGSGSIDSTGYAKAVLSCISLEDDGPPSPSFCGTAISPSYNLASATLKGTVPAFFRIRTAMSNGDAYYKFTDYRRAIKEYTTAIKLGSASPKWNPELEREIWDAYVQRGVMKFIQRNYLGAIADWKAAIRIQHKKPAPYTNIGYAYLELGRVEKAVVMWRRVLKRNSGLSDGWAGLALGYYLSHRPRAATAAYTKAVSLDPRYASFTWLRYAQHWTKNELQTASLLRSKRV